MPLDYNILNRGVSVLDNQRLQQDFELKKQAAQMALQKSLAGGDLPSAIQEYQYYNQLDPQAQAKYLQVKRADKIIDTGSGFARFDPATGQAIPVGNLGGSAGSPLTKGLTPEQQRQADLDARAAQDQFQRGLDVQKKALRAAENLVGQVDPVTGQQLTEGNISGVRANRGGLSRFIPNISNSAVDAEADLTTLTNLLTTENLGLLKGVLSDTDMKVLASIGSGELAGSDKKSLGALRRMRSALSGRVTGMQGAKDSLQPNQMPPLASDFIDMPPQGNLGIPQLGDNPMQQSFDNKKAAASGIIITKEQYDKLPSGTIYKEANGKTYRKP